MSHMYWPLLTIIASHVDMTMTALPITCLA